MTSIPIFKENYWKIIFLREFSMNADKFMDFEKETIDET
jgi:hypothetical protein